MASSVTNKELLNLEQQRICSPESRLVICKKNSSPLRKSKKKDVNEYKHESRLMDSTAPKSEVLGKVKNFLCEFAQANKQLEIKMQENPQLNYDIEALGGNETEIIEMDLLLGVADLQTPEALKAAEAAAGSLRPWGNESHSSGCRDSEDDSCSGDSEGSSDNEDDDKPCRGQGQRTNSVEPSAGEKSKKRPKIVVLN